MLRVTQDSSQFLERGLEGVLGNCHRLELELAALTGLSICSGLTYYSVLSFSFLLPLFNSSYYFPLASAIDFPINFVEN